MTELRALLLTDVVDSTRVAEAIGDAAMTGHWIAHDRAARELLRTWRGREIEKTDGIMAVFDSAADAAAYAVDYHRALAGLGVPFRARAGLHVGPMTLRENSPADVAVGAKRFEVDGLGVSIAARVMSAAAGGQTLLTAAARHALGESPLRVQSHGYWRLKGVHDPVELFEVGDAQAPFAPPPDEDKAYRVVRVDETWQPVRQVRHNLAPERDAFIGRSAELQRLARRLESGCRLLTLLGPGGTGKTRIARRYAMSWLGEWPGGVTLCLSS
jgi:class 3 adenylate cyclase